MNNYVQQLISQADNFGGGLPGGSLGRRLALDGGYEEVGLTITREDVPLTRLYSALAIYTRDVYLNSKALTGMEYPLLADAVQAVEAMEMNRYGAGAYPYRQPGFPHTAELARFPTGLAQAALSEQLNLALLNDPDLVHEWTLKAGIRLYNQILGRLDESVPVEEPILMIKRKLRRLICSDDGPYGYFKAKKPMHDVFDALIPVLGTAVVSGVPGTQALLVPVVICVGMILVKKGLNTYCEPKPELMNQSGEKMKVLHCRELGFDCDVVVRAENEAEILQQAAEHAQAVHQFAVTPVVAEMAKGLIKEEA